MTYETFYFTDTSPGEQRCCSVGPRFPNQYRSAREVLADACKYLADAPFFGITAEVWRDHQLDSGQKVQFTRVVELEVKRPDRLHARVESPHVDQQFWYNGKALAVLDGRRNLYSSTAMPSSLDAMIDSAHDQFGIEPSRRCRLGRHR